MEHHEFPAGGAIIWKPWNDRQVGLERGFDLAMVGRYAWVPVLFGDIGYVLGGWLSGRLMRAGWPLTLGGEFRLIVVGHLDAPGPCANVPYGQDPRPSYYASAGQEHAPPAYVRLYQREAAHAN